MLWRFSSGEIASHESAMILQIKRFPARKAKTHTQMSPTTHSYRASLVKAALKAIKCEIGMRYGYTWCSYTFGTWMRKRISSSQNSFRTLNLILYVKLTERSFNITEVKNRRTQKLQWKCQATCTTVAAHTAII